MSEYDDFITHISRGYVPPLPKNMKEENIEVVRNNIFTLPGENLSWIGKVQMRAAISSRGEVSENTIFGVSSYRFLAFIKSAFGSGNVALSFWYDVDFEGTTWEKGTFKKGQYRGISMDRPALKKDLFSREIIAKVCAIRIDGKRETLYEIKLYDLKVLIPETGKYEGGKADFLYQQITEIYDRRKPVTLHTLELAVRDPRQLLNEKQTSAAAKPPTARQTTPIRQSQSKSKQKASEPEPGGAESTCPSCGEMFHPGVKFCGKCGAKIENTKREKPQKTEEKSANTCPACGETIEITWKACPFCGATIG